MEKRQERVQAILNENDIQVHAIKESIRNQQTAIETQTAKIRDLNEVLYKIDNVQIPALNTRLSQMTTRDEFVAFKKEHDIQVSLLVLQHLDQSSINPFERENFRLVSSIPITILSFFI